MTLVDTCFLIDLIKGDRGAEQVASRIPDLKTTVISMAEFLFGAKKSQKKEIYKISKKFVGFFPVIPFDAEAAVIYADIASAMRWRGSRISTFDELIAAIALRHHEPLITRDRHYKEINGLELISY